MQIDQKQLIRQIVASSKWTHAMINEGLKSLADHNRHKDSYFKRKHRIKHLNAIAKSLGINIYQ